ncbi:MAG: hypothetical protein A2284_01795 [Deltaproteobacteria bacterium RIFOXYA12_FULL_61_11]|nr:MAG: hypothetical protein A2284_01795 [Deltaproteobacteria bacterium RIFOXYA12_FULL_61_11]
MIERPRYLHALIRALRRSPVAALLGPRQCGKTTLARQFCQGTEHVFYDLESPSDEARLANPELVLGQHRCLVVLDEIQRRPELFKVIRVLADRPEHPARFLLLGSASPLLAGAASESLAGRIEFIELAGFDLVECSGVAYTELWQRGAFPRAYLAGNEDDSRVWREGFIQTFLERDLPQLGFPRVPTAMRRFWTMLAHLHGQIWNSSALGRSMGITDKTVRTYLDLLTGSFMLRQLQPWFENLSKRQVKAPKVYLRDSGLLHQLLAIPDRGSLLAHPKLSASFEGFVLEQFLNLGGSPQAYFWATHAGAELDLLFFAQGRRFGLEVKYHEAPTTTRSMHTVLESLRLERLFVVHPGKHRFDLAPAITAWPVETLADLVMHVGLAPEKPR